MAESRPTRYLATDVGSTTTKAVLIELVDGEYRLTGRANSPTTVEAPVEDVMVGVWNSIRRLENEVGQQLLSEDDGSPMESTVDAFVSTSSAGGGLQMTVGGLMKSLTAESAQRAALGAGAVVLDVVSIDDARAILERIRRIKQLRPDIILLSGGTNTGNISHNVALAEYMAAARPEPRFGSGYRVPMIYAGNELARSEVRNVLDDIVDLYFVENLRPTLEMEVLEPTRNEIHRLFLEHVMQHAPGYAGLMEWTGSRVAPTPVAFGEMIRAVAETRNANILAVDIGGATTDIFSVVDEDLNRTVSANMGMSYSISNVLVESGVDAVARWLPFEVTERDLRNWNGNKMIRPTTLPQTFEDLMLEQAVAREALRLSMEHHRELAVTLKGVQAAPGFKDVFRSEVHTGRQLVRLLDTDIIIGSGGGLSHAPRRSQALMMLVDSLQPEGVTEIYVDSIFILPHLGILAEIDRDAAMSVLEKDGLVPLGACVAPVSARKYRDNDLLATVEVRGNGSPSHWELLAGGLRCVPLSDEPNDEVEIRVTPQRYVDVGAGPGGPVRKRVKAGHVGLLLDGRGRPVGFPDGDHSRRMRVLDWMRRLEAYPDDLLAGYEQSNSTTSKTKRGLL